VTFTLKYIIHKSDKKNSVEPKKLNTKFQSLRPL